MSRYGKLKRQLLDGAETTGRARRYKDRDGAASRRTCWRGLTGESVGVMLRMGPPGAAWRPDIGRKVVMCLLSSVTARRQPATLTSSEEKGKKRVKVRR